MSRVYFCKVAITPKPGVPAGSPFYYWTHYITGRHYSLTPPRPWQLISPEFMRQWHRTAEDVESLSARFDACASVRRFYVLIGELDAIIKRVRQLRVDTASRAPVKGQFAELYRHRLHYLDTLIESLENVRRKFNYRATLTDRRDSLIDELLKPQRKELTASQLRRVASALSDALLDVSFVIVRSEVVQIARRRPPRRRSRHGINYKNPFKEREYDEYGNIRPLHSENVSG
jgi:hypothetical protein